VIFAGTIPGTGIFVEAMSMPEFAKAIYTPAEIFAMPSSESKHIILINISVSDLGHLPGHFPTTWNICWGKQPG